MAKRISWMAVTPDEYEEPIFIADTCKELAYMLGVKPQTVRRSFWYENHQLKNGYGRPSKYKIRKIIDDWGEEDG